MRIGALMPNFASETTQGPIQFYEWLEDSWCVLFSHPADFTPVCTTELGKIAEKAHEFYKRGVKLLGHSCDSVEKHKRWIQDIRFLNNDVPLNFPYPIISDPDKDLAFRLDMVSEDMMDVDGPVETVRALYIVGPDRKIKLSMFYPNTTGRNVEEVLRAVDSLQLTYRLKVATPVNWTMGREVLVTPDVRDEELQRLFPRGVEKVSMPSGIAYVRKTSDYTYSNECWDGAIM